MRKTDPKLDIKNLIQSEWVGEDVDLDGNPPFHTGWYDRNSGGPQITFTNNEESVIGGGNTGHTGLSPDGSTSQMRAGLVLINCWSGTRNDLTSAGVGNTALNPKALSYQMAHEVHGILQDYYDGFIDGEQKFNTLSGGSVREIPDTEKEYISRHEITAIYTYKK